MAADQEPFTFNWLALKLLGRNLYSNPWSALSELAANGLDAGARIVYVYLDARDKASATIEVIDDGSGMSREDIKTYVKVGFNKREHQATAGPVPAPKVKGRKGIGKLAALYLTQHFYLATKHADGSSEWELDAREDAIADDDFPALATTVSLHSTPNDALWSGLDSGTRLTLIDVDLTGYGPRAIRALGSRLANQFLLPESAAPQIVLWVQTADGDTPDYEPVRKQVAFGNLVEIVTNFDEPNLVPAHFETVPPHVRVPARDLPDGEHIVTQRVSILSAEDIQAEALQELAGSVDRESRTYHGRPYALTGWIGVHATIVSEEAQKNDPRFEKNKFYNPAQLRVYVRDKLASEHLLGQLGITGTYINYIEGEISFDLLDDDTFDDIATSNRQDFDQTDLRVTLLRGLVRPIVLGLINKRDRIATEMSQQAKAAKQRADGLAKQQFSDQLEVDLARHREIPEETRAELQTVIVNKIEGDVAVKRDYRVFISHSTDDLPFARFIDEALRTRGATPDEIFFTSRPGETAQVLDDRALGIVIKECITSANTLVFYLTSKHFRASEFCLFEGGAGWATRAVGDYLKLNMEFDSIPAFLTNGRPELSMIVGDSIELTATLHNYIVAGVLNPMVEHLNRGRAIAGSDLIAPFSTALLPTEVEMNADGSTPEDYFDPDIAAQWHLLVEPEVDAYLDTYKRDTARGS
ncbi:ATP-binding protein [Demequina sp. NBRC 110053]|uniref:ATP-binding protein n=1 Tax=Demequina sp. NBRC 110053 TaxID=1570342 RepID=UPI0009FE2218|nr:ATP-binding protein [Demequina sp. NBRC 110053]